MTNGLAGGMNNIYLFPRKRRMIVEVSMDNVSHEVRAAWWEPGRKGLGDSVLVDDRALVLTFPVNYSFPYRDERIPWRVVKYSDKEQYAPHRADSIKLSTLRHFREEYPECEGIGDPMEGRAATVSSLTEVVGRRDVPGIPRFADLVEVEVTYQVDGTALIYSTSKAEGDAPPNPKNQFASVISDVSKFAKWLGIESARQIDEKSFAAVTELERDIETSMTSSPVDRTVHVYHGPVVYDDDSYKTLEANKVALGQRALALHFFKETKLAYQDEYRFVLDLPGKRPVQETLLLGITPELRSMIEKR